MLLDGTFKHLGRTRQIIKVLVKYGFEDIVFHSFLQNIVPRRMLLSWTRENRIVSATTRWERIRMAAEEAGPSAIKIAQIMSNRSDIIPEELIVELKKLQSEVKTFPFSVARKILDEELPHPYDEIFEEFNEVPIGSASIGQVYKAKLRTGEEVVVKLRRPGVGKLLVQDLEIAKSILPHAKGVIEQNGLTYEAVEDSLLEIEKSTVKELDYLNEARNIENFRKFYRKRKDFYVPRAYREYSTEKLLIIEFADGCKITDQKQLEEWSIDAKKVAERGMDIYLTQIFEFGYFHADPHPGNIIIQKDGRICLIDFGMVGKLMQRDKMSFAQVFVAMAQGDSKKMALNLRKLCISHDIENVRMLEYDLQEIIEEYTTLDVAESKIEDLILSLQGVMRDYNMRVPGSVTLIFRALGLLEGIGKQIHPEFNINQFVQPYGFKLLKEEYSMTNLAKEGLTRFDEISALLSSIPVEVRSILKKTRQGKLNVQIEHKGYDPLLRKMDRVVNRFILTFIIFTLVLGSSILATIPMSENYMAGAIGLPILSVIGYAFSLFLGTILLFAVLRTRKL
ncbi:MAG: AarF/ABC1/UbiB kinase family protein [Chitinophagales bacterium]|nr:AarF/ABC1/UbiB kinase family protein [Chitinophagales bacterium]